VITTTASPAPTKERGPISSASSRKNTTDRKVSFSSPLEQEIGPSTRKVSFSSPLEQELGPTVRKVISQLPTEQEAGPIASVSIPLGPTIHKVISQLPTEQEAGPITSVSIPIPISRKSSRKRKPIDRYVPEQNPPCPPKNILPQSFPITD
jgi:hypothetical protein